MYRQMNSERKKASLVLISGNSQRFQLPSKHYLRRTALETERAESVVKPTAMQWGDFGIQRNDPKNDDSFEIRRDLSVRFLILTF